MISYCYICFLSPCIYKQAILYDMVINNYHMNMNLDQTTQQISTTSPLLSSISVLTSSAFPQNKPIQESSIFHRILRQSQNTRSRGELQKNITMRLTNKDTDIIQIWNLHLEWFPLKYGFNFYERITEGRYRCLVSEVEVEIEWEKLRLMLKDKYKREYDKYTDDVKQGCSQKDVLIQPSRYFEAQGIKLEHLKDPNQLPFSVPQVVDPNLKPVVKVKIMVGVMVFDLTISDGYLKGTWFEEVFLSAANSIYINTIGVMEEFRKHGLAQKMINWVIKQTANERIFKFVYLHVIEYNAAAIKLYERLGFKELGTLDNYYTIDERPYKAKLLGTYINGGERRVGWGEWLGKLWRR